MQQCCNVCYLFIYLLLPIHYHIITFTIISSFHVLFFRILAYSWGLVFESVGVVYREDRKTGVNVKSWESILNGYTCVFLSFELKMNYMTETKSTNHILSIQLIFRPLVYKKALIIISSSVPDMKISVDVQTFKKIFNHSKDQGLFFASNPEITKTSNTISKRPELFVSAKEMVSLEWQEKSQRNDKKKFLFIVRCMSPWKPEKLEMSAFFLHLSYLLILSVLQIKCLYSSAMLHYTVCDN